MTVHELLERLEKDKNALLDKVAECDRNYEKAIAENDQNSAAHWEFESKNAWRHSIDLTITIMNIWERVDE